MLRDRPDQGSFKDVVSARRIFMRVARYFIEMLSGIYFRRDDYSSVRDRRHFSQLRGALIVEGKDSWTDAIS